MFRKVSLRATLTLVSLLLVLGLLATACPGTTPTTPPTDKPHEGESLNILVWADHAGEDVLGPFKEKYGVHVNIKTFEMTPTAVATIQGSSPGFWDVIVVDDADVPLFVENGFIQPLDPARFDLSDFWDEYKHMPTCFIGDTMYAIPTKFGYQGLAYNTNFVDPADVESYACLWDDKYAGKIGFYYYPLQNVETLGFYLGLEPGPLTDEQLDQMADILRDIKKQLKMAGDVTGCQQALANESVYIIAGGAEFITAGMAQDGLPVTWTLPNEGGLRWNETVTLGAGAQNQELAELLIEYYISPEGQARLATSEAYWAMPTNSAASAFLTGEQMEILQWDAQPGYLAISMNKVAVGADEAVWDALLEEILLAN